MVKVSMLKIVLKKRISKTGLNNNTDNYNLTRTVN